MMDAGGGDITKEYTAEDIKHADFSSVHYLSGPIRVFDVNGKPAKPGGLLAIEICNLGPLPGDEWGFTAIFDRENVADSSLTIFLAQLKPYGVRFPGLTHPGIIGTAPLMELLNIWNKKERELEETGPQSLKLCEVLHSRPLANLPLTKGCLLGKGINVDDSRRQHFLDAAVAYKCAVLNAIDHLSRFGYSKKQVYFLLSCCPCEGRISGITDSPNVVATLPIPISIFDQDIRPKPNKVHTGARVVRNPGTPLCTNDGKLPIPKIPLLQHDYHQASCWHMESNITRVPKDVSTYNKTW
ncbi:Acetamidase/Formamidase family protein [Forsythia ovata]|uniref:Acetamidase/Formamidase family protein n=1 Tax=Forsythia ovata TaxID=205694 RepID=A0ABD1UDN7_9LAMI